VEDGVIDWLKELAPGTFLVDKTNKSYHMVIHVEVQRMPITWTQLNITTLSPFKLDHISVESSSFYERWYRVPA
jgi:hypothetical protein